MLDLQTCPRGRTANHAVLCVGEKSACLRLLCVWQRMQGGWYLGELPGLVQVALLSTQKACLLLVVKAQNLHRNLALSLKCFSEIEGFP